ncbi:MAG: DUF362 domain-containing protein [Desulfitobacteriaceae bacterium]
MAAFVLEKLCRGCQRCILACPNQAIMMIAHSIIVNAEKCSECEECLEVCMHGAITFLVDEEAQSNG